MTAPHLSTAARRFGCAWVALTLAFAIHVVDEAAHGFLSVYNPTVRAIRQQWPLLPLPTFTFSVWFAGLTFAVVGLLALAPLAFRGRRWLVRFSYAYAGLMFANGLVHLGGSFHLGRFLPGLLSSPLLWLASAWLFVAAMRVSRPSTDATFDRRTS